VDFGQALTALKAGKRVRRDFWATSMFLVLIPGSTVTIQADRPLGIAAPHLIGDEARYRPHLDVCTFSGGVPTLGPWAKLDDDIVAEDWSEMPGYATGGEVRHPIVALPHESGRDFQFPCTCAFTTGGIRTDRADCPAHHPAAPRA
jgi:hypothetical protein